MIGIRTSQMHETFSVGMTRAEAEVILKVVHAGMNYEKFGETDKNIAASYLKTLNTAMIDNAVRNP